MSEDTETDLKTAALSDHEAELESTRRVLERVPSERFDWRPHARSYTLGELATHVANLVVCQQMILEQDGFDLAVSRSRAALVPDREALLATFDRNVEAARKALAETDDTALARAWTLRRDDEVLLTMPRLSVLRRMGISHMVHHRAQLTVYLRLLEVPVPGPYGPSADEQTTKSTEGA